MNTLPKKEKKAKEKPKENKQKNTSFVYNPRRNP